jgi:hypothetical protein
MADNNGKQNTSEQSDDHQRGRRAAIVAILVRVVVPVGFAYLVYKLAGQAKANLGTVQDLIQLAIAMVAGVAAYTIIAEVTLDRLPIKFTAKLNKVERKLAPVEARLSQLSNTLQALIDQHGMEILFTETRVLEKAKALQADAEHRIEVMWTVLPYDKALKHYFAETLSDDGGPHTSRIVAARTVKEDYLIDHIEKAWERLAEGKYEIYLVYYCNYEVVIADGKRAGLFIYSKRFESCCMSSPDGRFVDTVAGLVQGLKQTGQKLPVPEGGAKEEHLANVKQWVHNYYRALPQE